MPNGNILVADNNDNVVWQCSPAGALTNFSGTGLPYIDVSNDVAAPQAVAVQGDEIVVMGYGNVLARYYSSGSLGGTLDTSFGSSGVTGGQWMLATQLLVDSWGTSSWAAK